MLNPPRVARTAGAISIAVPLLFGVSLPDRVAHAEEPGPLSPREIVERAGRTVVLIEVESKDQTSQGSGFVIEADGVIITNLHVVDGATKVVIKLRDGTRLEDVAVRAFDVEHDLAVLVVDLPGDVPALTAVELGDTSAIEPGMDVVVIGNPLGLEQTVTQGIVSAWREPSRQAPGDSSSTQAVMLPDCRLLQISAAISPGSSGGPVFNDRAEVVGVATAGVLYGLAGLNFAVPVDELPALVGETEAMDLETFRKRVEDVRLGLARPHFERAEIACERDEREKAKDSLERALQLFPRYLEALLLSGRMAAEDGLVELAETRLSTAVTVDEDSAEAWYLLGTLYHLTSDGGDGGGRLSRAEAAYERALVIDGRHAGAAYGLAAIQLGRGFHDRAEDLLLLAVENEPGLVDAQYMLGEIYLDRGQASDAKDAFEKVLWEDPNHALAHFGLAKLYTELARTPFGDLPPHGPGPDHWEEFLRLSEGDPALAKHRELAIRFLREYLPHLLDE